MGYNAFINFTEELSLKTFKFFTNDIVLFLTNTALLIYIYLQHLQYYEMSLFVQIFMFGIGYYFVSLGTTLIVVIFLYSITYSLLHQTNNYSIFKKLELLIFIFDNNYKNINSVNDYRLSVKKCLDKN